MATGYIPFTNEHKQLVNQTDLAAYLAARGEELKHVGKEYGWERHGSARITGNRWYHHASGEGGYPVKFLQHFFNLDYKDAMLELLAFNGVSIEDVEVSTNNKKSQAKYSHQPTPPPKEVIPFTLPPKDENMKRAFAYLTKTRHIPSDVVSFFASERKIYQADKTHYQNIVFVGHDESNEPVYASKHSPSGQVKFHGEVTGSNKRHYCFNYFPEQAKERKPSSGRLVVFEAAIDALSYIALTKNENRSDGLTWQNDSYMALGCTYNGALFHYLDNAENRPREIILALDNDKAGLNAAANTLLELTQKYPEIDVSLKLSHSKDWNEDLKAVAQGLKPDDNICLIQNNSPTIKVFSSPEALIYKLAEDKHISKVTRSPLASFFVLDK